MRLIRLGKLVRLIQLLRRIELRLSGLIRFVGFIQLVVLVIIRHRFELFVFKLISPRRHRQRPGSRGRWPLRKSRASPAFAQLRRNDGGSRHDDDAGDEWNVGRWWPRGVGHLRR